VGRVSLGPLGCFLLLVRPFWAVQELAAGTPREAEGQKRPDAGQGAARQAAFAYADTPTPEWCCRCRDVQAAMRYADVAEAEAEARRRALRY
jgi:hypothetical protein